MPVPSPPRIPEALDDVQALASALVAFQQWATQLYNSVRPAVLRMERIAEIEPYTDAISNPPTQAEVEALQERVNLIIAASRTQVSA